LITYSLTDNVSDQRWLNKLNIPDFYISNDIGNGTDATYTSKTIKENAIHPAYQETVVSFSLGTLHVRKIYRIYDDSPVIACDIYLKGSSNIKLDGKVANLAD